jgi:N-acetylglucosamine-6-phosphate deacetylase
VPPSNETVKHNFTHQPSIQPKLGSFLKVPDHLGVIDLHFHGAFGIDLMRASRLSEAESYQKYEFLLKKLYLHGMSGVMATTLSTSIEELLPVLDRIGSFITKVQPQQSSPMTQFLGIHLEGPFLNPGASGAHLPHYLRPTTAHEIKKLWKASHHTLKIITLAPEIHSAKELKKITHLAKKLNILLSLGHSLASTKESIQAFKNGFSGLTHAWNAMPFHHRKGGPLVGALELSSQQSKRAPYLELIIDQAHVSLPIIRLTRQSTSKICFVSDCAPAAALKNGMTATFDTMTVKKDGPQCVVSRHGRYNVNPPLPLAGSGLLLLQAYEQWLKDECASTGVSLPELFKTTYHHLSTLPFYVLNFSKNDLKKFKLPTFEWTLTKRRPRVNLTLKPLKR